MRPLTALKLLLVAAASAVAGPAGACVSCSYTPEVVTTPAPGAKAKPKKQVQRKAPAAKKQAVKPQRPARKTVKAAPAETGAGESKEAVSTSELVQSDADDASSGTTAAKDCKRFVPTAGTTVTVPCE